MLGSSARRWWPLRTGCDSCDGRILLQIYRQCDNLMWCVGPETFHSDPEETGRGLAGYVAQVNKEVRIPGAYHT